MKPIGWSPAIKWKSTNNSRSNVYPIFIHLPEEPAMAHEFTTSYIKDSTDVFNYYKKLAERAMEQVTDEQLIAQLDDEMNSIAIIVKHMAGNMGSRWTDFLTSD